MVQLEMIQITDNGEKGYKNQLLTSVGLFNLLHEQVLMKEINLNIHQRIHVFTESCEDRLVHGVDKFMICPISRKIFMLDEIEANPKSRS